MASFPPASSSQKSKSAQASGGESFAALFEESLNRKEMRVGEVITAEVLSVDENWVVVNAGLKSESVIPADEFRNDAGQVDVKPGDFVSVSIEALEDGFGATRLSRDKAKRMAAWLELEKALESGEKIKGVITGKVKGGLTVMAKGIRAFLPGSLVDLRPVKDTTPYEGKEMEFKVIKLDRKRNNVVVSRRAVLEETAGAEREHLLASLQEGATVKGVVKNITDYGAFVDLGGIDGLLHITDLAWRRVKHPSEVLNVGDEVTAKVLKFDAEKNRVSLGVKQLEGDPFTNFIASHEKNSVVAGTVKSVDAKGAMVDLGGVEGYLRASEFSRDRVDDLAKHLKEGDNVQAMIINVDRKNRSINLSVKAREMSEETEAMKQLKSEQAAASAGATNLGALLRAKLDKGNNPQQ